MGHEDPKSIIALAAGGFKDMSRIAKSSPRMWSDIFKQNRENLLDSIDLFEKHLKMLKKWLRRKLWRIGKWMKKANSLTRDTINLVSLFLILYYLLLQKL